MLIVGDSEKLIVKKLDAAQRQLNCAIELWFKDADEVSIHTLVAAAYQIIHDIKEHKRIERDLLYDSAMIKDEYRKQWIDTLKKSQNFFKHADRDPDPEGSIEFSPFGNLVFIISGLTGLQLLGATSSPQTSALFLWLVIHEPALIKNDYLAMLGQRSGINDLQDLKAIPKAAFFDHYMNMSLGLQTFSTSSQI